jgi:hypothetical protein
MALQLLVGLDAASYQHPPAGGGTPWWFCEDVGLVVVDDAHRVSLVQAQLLLLALRGVPHVQLLLNPSQVRRCRRRRRWCLRRRGCRRRRRRHRRRRRCRRRRHCIRRRRRRRRLESLQGMLPIVRHEAGERGFFVYVRCRAQSIRVLKITTAPSLSTRAGCCCTLQRCGRELHGKQPLQSFRKACRLPSQQHPPDARDVVVAAVLVAVVAAVVVVVVVAIAAVVAGVERAT